MNKTIRLISSVFLSIMLFESVIAASGDIKWSVPIRGNIGSSPAIVSSTGQIIIGAANNSIYSYDKLGNYLWHYNTEDYVGASATISLDEKLVFIADYSGAVYALDALTGALQWQFKASSTIAASPALSLDGSLYIGSNDHKLYALEQTTGRLQWTYTTGGEIGGSPIYISAVDTVYVGSSDGFLYALDPKNNTDHLRWRVDLGGKVSTPSMGTMGIMYVGTHLNKLYAIDTNDSAPQRILWNLTLDGKVAGSPSIDNDGTIFVSSYDTGKLYAIDPQLMSVRWEFTVGGNIYASPAIDSNGVVYVPGLNNELVAINAYLYDPQNPENNLEKWRKILDSSIIASPTISNDGTLLISTMNANLYALDSASDGAAFSVWPMYRKNAMHTAINDDYDGDLLPDSWEELYGFDKLVFTDRNLDSDNDSLGLLDEYLANTFPNQPDSDNDQILDGVEVSLGLDPLNGDDALLDLDNDGLTNMEEAELGTSLAQSDTDNDGLSDGDEVNSYLTDPLSNDSDNDGLPDGWEVANNSHFNPLEPSDATADFDSDGLNNVNEYLHNTNVFDSDSDSDQILDGWEVANGLDPLNVNDGELDSDGDGLTNVQEYSYNTNPLEQDSDGDTVNDYDEIFTYFTDPNVPDTEEEVIVLNSPFDGSLDEWEPLVNSVLSNNIMAQNGQSLLVSNRTSVNSGIAHDMLTLMESEKEYTLEADVFLDSVSASSLKASLKYKANGIYIYKNFNFDIGTSGLLQPDWNQVSIPLTMPSMDNIKFLSLQLNGVTAGVDLYFDNLKIIGGPAEPVEPEPPVDPDALLINDDFEIDLTGWSNSGGTMVQGSPGAQSSNYAMQFTTTSKFNTVSKNVLDFLLPNTTYVITYDAYNFDSESKSIKSIIQYKQEGIYIYKTLNIGTTELAGNSWTPITIEFTTPDVTGFTIAKLMFSGTTAPMDFSVDNITLRIK